VQPFAETTIPLGKDAHGNWLPARCAGRPRSCPRHRAVALAEIVLCPASPRFSLRFQVFFLSGEVQENLSLFAIARRVRSALRAQFRSIIRLVVAKHAPGGMQQLAHDRDQGLQLGLAPIQQTLIKGPQRGIVLHRH